MGSQPGVLCSGNLVYDTLVSPVEELHWGPTTFVDCIECHAGGNGANTARALATLGVPVRLLGAVGRDVQGRLLLRTLEQSGVDTSFIEHLKAPTSASVVVVNESGERKFFHQMGASREALRNGIQFTPELCRGVTHFHLASLFVLPRLRAQGPETLVRARAAGLTTSFDTNWDPEAGWMGTLAPCLPYIDVLFMNEEEARMITGSVKPSEIAKAVIRGGLGTLALKMGGNGCAIYTEGSEILCPAFEVTAKDTTGAGDCFAAGFLAAMLDGAALPEAGRFANAVAALSVQKTGATTGVVGRLETERWMAQAPIRAR
ncbi:MAG TPA: carbohydrate kinase family protein [Bryobacteraceae bacterium]|jgi:sugar/nucleoside kinase (ribokinase family)